MDQHANTPPLGEDGPLPDALESDVTVIGSPSSITPHSYPSGLTARELSHALRGEMLGHFLLQQFIGGGGMGVVFKALDTTLDRIVAVKVVASHRLGDDDLQRRFLVEAQSTARLDHPNIARVHYIGRDRGLPYIVFEYIDGLNVRDLVAQRGPLPVGEAISYVYQIAHALAHAWQREVVHRDIKPSNILVTAEGQAKLVDMGLARLRQMDAGDDELTATGITLGTFDYISPEQARDPRLADARSDIYSLGCTLFYMLAGQAPFAQGTGLQKLLQHQSERPPDLRSFRSDLPDSVSRLVRHMLAKAPGDRPQSPVDLVGELTAILDELGVPLPFTAAPLPWTPQPRAVPRWKLHTAWAAPVAALLALGLLVDRFTKDRVRAAPFPPLHQGTATAPLSDVPDAITAPPLVPDATTAAPTMEATAPVVGGDPSWKNTFDATLPLSKELDLRGSLWDIFSKWPVQLPTLGPPETPNAQGSAPPATVRGSGAANGEKPPIDPLPDATEPFPSAKSASPASDPREL